MMDDRETVDLTGEEFYDEDDLEELEEPDELDETAGADGPDGARSPRGGAGDPHVPGGEEQPDARTVFPLAPDGAKRRLKPPPRRAPRQSPAPQAMR